MDPNIRLIIVGERQAARRREAAESRLAAAARRTGTAPPPSGPLGWLTRLGPASNRGRGTAAA